MPRGYNRYDFVVDNGNFNPYQSMTKMLVPFQAYKEVFDKEQDRVLDYGKKASVFKYLADRLPEDSQAARIYQGYMKDFEEEAKDFTKNGRTALNSRNLLDLWRRYNNEIGQLELAEKNRQKEFDKRMANKDTSMLYATDVLDIDDFIGNNSPNLYSVSGNALYTKGAALGKAISDREVTSGDNGSVLGKYYRNWKETQGVRNSDIREFINRPDVQEELQRYMKAEGLDNLTGANRERAEQQLLSGFYTGIEYSEKNNLHRDLGVMTVQEKAQNARAEKEFEMKKEKWEREKKLEDAIDRLRFRQAKDENGNPMVDEKGNPVMELNPDYLKGSGYTINPTNGNIVKDKTTQTKEDKDAEKEAAIQTKIANSKQNALQKITSKNLANDGGFDLEYGGTEGITADRVHYDYAGVLANYKGEWKHGNIGDAHPNRTGPIGRALHGRELTEDWLGDYSAETNGSGWGSASRRIVSASEMASLMSDREFNEALIEQFDAAHILNDAAVERKLHEHKDKVSKGTYTRQDALNDLYKEGYTNPSDIQLVEVSKGDKKDYLIAVQR